MVAFLAQSGSRRVVGVVAGGALITWLLLQGRLRPKFLVGGLIGIAAILVALQQLADYRMYGFVSERGSEVDILVRVDDNFLRLCQTVYFFPNLAPYVDLQPLYHTLALPIPRALWPGKPSDPGYDLSVLLMGRSMNTSVTSSIVGELYAMHGLIAVFLGGLLFGRLANMWNKILALPGVNKSILYGFGVMVLFVGLRSMQDVVIMSYGVLGWLVIASLLRNKRSAAIVRGS
jgi:hypothetical protein